MSYFKPLARAILDKAMLIGPVRAPLRAMSLRGWLPAFVHVRLPVVRPFRVRTPSGRSFTYEPSPSDLVSRRVYWMGTFGLEPESTEVFWELAKRSKAFLDLGSNTGYYTLLATAANAEIRAFAFEPVPRIFELLKRHVTINGVDDRCRLFNLAIADHDGTAKFHVPNEPLPTSASLNTDGFRGFAGELVEVQVTTVDRAIPADVKVDLVKLDVEGFEDKALLGMARILRDDRPILIVECLRDGPFRQVEDILRSYGYRIFHLLPEGPTPREHITPDERDVYWNYLFLPEDRSGDILNDLQAVRRGRSAFGHRPSSVR